MVNLFKKLIGRSTSSQKSCCSVEIKEVNQEEYGIEEVEQNACREEQSPGNSCCQQQQLQPEDGK